MHATPNIGITLFGLVVLPAMVIVGALVLTRVARLLRGGCRTHTKPRPRGEFSAGMAALFTTAAICAVPLLLLVGYVRFGSLQNDSEVRTERGTRSEITVTRLVDVPAPPRLPELPLFRTPEAEFPEPHDGAAQESAEIADQPGESPAASEIRLQTADGKIVVVSLPAEIVEQLSADNRTRVLEALSEAVPAGIRRAYALVPLPSPVSDPVTGSVQQVLTLSRLEALVHAVAGVWNEPVTAEQTADSPDDSLHHTSPLLAELDEHQERPAWIDNPGHGRIVVRTEFVDASEPAAESLQPMLCSALLQAAEKSVERQAALDDSAVKLVAFSLSDAAFKRSVKETYARTETISTTAEGPKTLRRTYALVEFPDSVLNEAAASLRTGVQRNRTRALGLAIGFAWLTVVLLSFAVRAGNSQSKLLRLAGTPVLGLLMLPCVLAAAGMIIAMSQGEIPALQAQPAIHAIDTTP